MVLAAPRKVLIDFGLRRAHGAEAGLMAARASYIAGFAGTATMLAEHEFGIPVFGTMAHSFIEAYDSESAAFESFARARPKNLTLLLSEGFDPGSLSFVSSLASNSRAFMMRKHAFSGEMLSSVFFVVAHNRRLHRVVWHVHHLKHDSLVDLLRV